MSDVKRVLQILSVYNHKIDFSNFDTSKNLKNAQQ